jgi:predicted ATPase
MFLETRDVGSENGGLLAMQENIITFPGKPAPGSGQAAKYQLPTLFTPLIGREQDVAVLCTLLRRPEVRLVILVGTGGVGKTRLVIQAALDMRWHLLDGTCFVGLAAVSDPLLLLLDNFELLVTAAPLLEELLAGCPWLKILVTSRTVLNLQAEHVFAVSPLALPDLTQLSDGEDVFAYTAVALFVERAQAVLPTLQVTQKNARVIAEICVLPPAGRLGAERSSCR